VESPIPLASADLDRGDLFAMHRCLERVGRGFEVVGVDEIRGDMGLDFRRRPACQRKAEGMCDPAGFVDFEYDLAGLPRERGQGA